MERYPDRPETELDTYELHGSTLREWYDFLTHDHDGQPNGHLAVPSSRYGTTGEACAWWALAFQCAYVDASGEVDDPEASVDEAMSMCVNDNGDVAGLIAEFWHAIPQVIKDQIGTEDDVRRLDG